MYFLLFSLQFRDLYFAKKYTGLLLEQNPKVGVEKFFTCKQNQLNNGKKFNLFYFFNITKKNIL